MSCIAFAVMMLLPIVTVVVVYRAPAAANTPAYQLADLPDSAIRPAPLPTTALPAWVMAVQAWTLPVWFAGVLAFAVRLTWSYRYVATLRRECDPAGGQLMETVERLARQMGIARTVRVLVSKLTDAPSVAGWLRPVILIPTATLLNLSVEQLEGILVHELAHIQRHDYLVNVLQTLADTLFFYQPAVWWVSSRIRRERELCCDDLVVEFRGDAVGYARALTKLERLRVTSSELAMRSNAGPLLYRIQRLTGLAHEPPPSRLPAVLALCFALLCLMTNLNWVQAQPQTNREATVRREAVWVDTVKYGDLPILIRALGTMTTPGTAELSVAASQATLLQDGQTASIGLRRSITIAGKVTKLDRDTMNGTVKVVIALRAPVPEFVSEPADGTIDVRTLNNVVYVGRPVLAQSDGEISLFKLEPDRSIAKRVKMRFGAQSVTSVVILEGLQPGDRVILSDMKKYDGYERIRLE